MEEKRRKINLKGYLISGLVSLIFGLAITAIFFFLVHLSISDGTAFAGLFLISAGALIWVSREGFFDIFSYGFRQMGSMIFSKKPTEYNDFPGYRENMKTKREKRNNYFLVIIGVGFLFILVTILLNLILK